MSNLKLFYEPKVYLIGKQQIDRQELQKFLDQNNASGWTTDAKSAGEELAEIGGRNCYQSWSKKRPGGNKEYLCHIKEVGHFSVVEHSVYTLLIEGVSRSLSLEFVRHRHLSPSQVSQRYIDCSDTAFVVPPNLAREVDKYLQTKDKLFLDNESCVGQQWYENCERSLIDYEALTNYLSSKLTNLSGTEKRKTARQTSRSILPNCVETKIQMTGNARAWRNFIELRASRHADTEIRVLAYKVWEKLVEESPNLFNDYQKTILEDGTYELTTPHRKI